MKSMKKFVAALLVLTMVMALAGTAMAATHKLVKGDFVLLKVNATAYSAPKSSKATKNVALKNSIAQVACKPCGKYVKCIVNASSGKTVYFKTCDLAWIDPEAWEYDLVVYVGWAEGGKGMSTCHSTTEFDPAIKNKKVKVIQHTNLRKNPGMKFKSQGVIKACTKLKLTGKLGRDNRIDIELNPDSWNWLQVCYKGKKLWVTTDVVEHTYDEDGNLVIKLY